MASAPRPQLEGQRNIFLTPPHLPDHSILTERRRLGQTDLSTKPGVPNAAKAEYAGVFDYAHLRVPLPKNLTGSGIFQLQKNNQWPESYFLMRRSTDGYVSATGMYKAAFPFASIEEEADERAYHKKMKSAGSEEVAGNVWISPDEALELSEEYDMRPWIDALLDNEDIVTGSKDRGKAASIKAPPPYKSKPEPMLPPPPSSRSRVTRSSSPVKQSAPSKERPMKTPKSRSRKAKQASVESDAAPTSSKPDEPVANGTEESTDDKESKEATTAQADEAPADEQVSTPAKGSDNKVRVIVDETVDVEDGKEIVHTNLKIEMPANSAELELPKDADEMIRVAHAMVEKAVEQDGGARASSSRKRKVEELADEEEELEEEAAAEAEASDAPLAKRQRVELLETLKKERVRSRTALGLAATFVIGAAITTFLG